MMVSTLFIALAFHAGTELRDPLDRNESLDQVEVRAETRELPNGDWEYLYTIVNPESGVGSVGEFRMKISCASSSAELDSLNSEEIQSDPPKVSSRFPQRDLSMAPRVHAYDAEGTLPPVFRPQSNVYWLIELAPGESVSQIRMISRAAPVLRSYRLKPVWLTSGWDYGKYFGKDVGIPDAMDFAVEGKVVGPGCSRTPAPGAMKS